MFQEFNGSGHGGKRPGAGRPKGPTGNSPRFSRALREEAVKRAHAVLSSDMSPVDVMLRVMRGDDAITPRQYAAAVDVAPYVCPRLSAVAVQPASGALASRLDAALRRAMSVQVIEGPSGVRETEASDSSPIISGEAIDIVSDYAAPEEPVT